MATDPEKGLKDSLLQNADATANRDSDEIVRAEGAASAVQKDTSDKESDDDEDEEEEEDLLGFRPAIFWLAVITGFIAILSELISDSIENGAKALGKAFAVADVYVMSVFFTRYLTCVYCCYCSAYCW